MQVIGYARGITIRLGIRGTYNGRVRGNGPVPIPAVQGVSACLDLVLSNLSTRQHGAPAVLGSSPAKPQQKTHVGLLRHQHVAPKTHVEALFQVLTYVVCKIVGTELVQNIENVLVNNAIHPRGPLPRGRHCPCVASGCVIIQNGHVDGILDPGTGKQGRWRRSSRSYNIRNAHVTVPCMPVGHVIQGSVVKRLVDHVARLPLGAELGEIVRPEDIGVLLELGVEIQHAQVGVAIEDLHVIGRVQKRGAAREAEPALSIPHAI